MAEKVDTPATPEKSSIAVLKELCEKHKFSTPQYEDSSVEYDGCFVYTCTAFGITECGTGSTAQEAKAKAAKRVISIAQDKFRLELTEDDFKPPNGAPTDFYNFIGALQEVCLKKQLQTPQFQIVPFAKKDEKQPIFKATCTLGKFSVAEKRPSKKGAKHAAAKAMIALLTEIRKGEEVKQIDAEDTRDTHKMEPCFYPQHLQSAKRLLKNAPKWADKKILVEDVCRTLGIPSQGSSFTDKKGDVEVFRMNVTYLSSFVGPRHVIYEDVLKHLQHLMGTSMGTAQKDDDDDEP